MVKIGPKEAAMRELRESKTTTKDKKATAKIIKNMLDPNKTAGGDVALPASKPKSKNKSELGHDPILKALPSGARAAVADAAAKSKDDDGIPSFLRRPPPTPEQQEKLRKKHAPVDSTAGLKVIEPYNPNDPIRKAIAKDLRDDSPSDTAQAINKALPKITSKKPKESNMRPKTKSKKSTSNGHVATDNKKTKLQHIVELLKRKEGCTTADVLKATGWPSVSMPQQARAAGLKLKKEKDGSVTRYRAA